MNQTLEADQIISKARIAATVITLQSQGSSKQASKQASKEMNRNKGNDESTDGSSSGSSSNSDEDCSDDNENKAAPQKSPPNIVREDEADEKSSGSVDDKDSKTLSFHEKRSLEAWRKRLQELQDYKRETGHCNVPLTAEMKEYRSLARWANNKRLQFHKNQLPAHEKEALDAIGFEWKQTRSDIWDEYYQHLIQFKEEYGHTRVFADYQYKNPLNELVPLRNWCRTQRMRFRKNTLQTDRMAKLDSIGFNWVTNNEAWGRLFQALAVFRRSHGHFQVPQDSYLGRWAVRLPLHKKELRKEQLGKLASIGFDFTQVNAPLSTPDRRQGVKRSADDDGKPSAKRQSAMYEDELAMPPTIERAVLAAATPHESMAHHAYNLTTLRGSETAWNPLIGDNSGQRQFNCSPAFLAMQSQHAMRQLPPMIRQPQHPLPFPPHAMPNELITQVNPSAAMPWSNHLAQPQTNAMNALHEAAGASQLSTPAILEELRRRAVLEDAQLRLQLQQQQYQHHYQQQHLQQQELQYLQQQDLHRQQDLQRLQHMEALNQGGAVHTANNLLRPAPMPPLNRFAPLPSQYQQQETNSAPPSQHQSNSNSTFPRHELGQLLAVEQQRSPTSRNTDLMHQIQCVLQRDQGLNNSGQGY
ncbi:hypothetical protein MPSEU_000019200 [Mayamaea pseudoterrestris]|nr:hypothetical protein MPSEU_000019200 [Mayamaea pseudoterrestris]